MWALQLSLAQFMSQVPAFCSPHSCNFLFSSSAQHLCGAVPGLGAFAYGSFLYVFQHVDMLEGGGFSQYAVWAAVSSLSTVFSARVTTVLQSDFEGASRGGGI